MNQTPQEHPPEIVSQVFKQVSKIETDGAKHWVRADLKAYLDGEMPGLRRWLTARHIAVCASCRAEARGLEQLSRHTRNLDQAAPDARLRARILASLPATPSAVVSSAPRLQIIPARSHMLPSRRPLNALAGLCALLLMASAFALTRFARTGAATHSSHAVLNDFAINTSSSNNSNTIAQRLVSVMSDSNPSNNTPGAEGFSQTAPSVTPAYTDPTSAEADRLAATLISDKLRAKRQLAAAGAAPANDKPGQPAPNIAAPAPTQVIIAVINVSDARRQVKKWAKEAGAQMTTLAYTATDSKPFDNRAFDTRSGEATGAALHGPEPARAETSGADANSPTLAAPAQTPALLRLKIPAQHADSLRACLGRVGTPVAVTQNGAGKNLEMVRPLGTDDLVPHFSAAIMLPAFAPKTTTSGERPATVTIVLRLQPGSVAPR